MDASSQPRKVDPDDAVALLQEAQVHAATLLGVFTLEDLTNLSHHLHFFDYEEGEVVMQQGEDATWVGIVLRGELEAAGADGRVVGSMGAGKVVGEIAFFTGGKRLADVRGAKSGVLAFIMMPNLEALFESCAHTAVKLIRVFGASSVYQLAHNPAAHPPLAWNLAPKQAESALTKWLQGGRLGPVECEVVMSQADLKRIADLFEFHRFAAGERVVDRFAKNDYICFVLDGSVDLRIDNHTLATRSAGHVANASSYYDGGRVLPCDIVGASDGVLGGLRHDAIEELAILEPALGLTLARMVGIFAVESVNEMFAAPAAKAVGGSGSRRRSIVGRVDSEKMKSQTAEVFSRKHAAALSKGRNLRQKAAEADEAAETAKRATQGAEVAKRNHQILTRKLEAEKVKIREQLLAEQQTTHLLRAQLKDLNLDVVHCKKESVQLAEMVSRLEAQIDRHRTLEQDLLEQLRQARAANHAEEVQELAREKETLLAEVARTNIERDALKQSLESEQAQRASVAEALAETQAHCARLEAGKAELARAHEAAIVDAHGAIEAALTQGHAERLADNQTLVATLALCEEHLHERSIELATHTANLERSEQREQHHAKLIQQQRLAAKCLGACYLLTLAPLRRRLRQVEAFAAEHERLVSKHGAAEEENRDLTLRLHAEAAATESLADELEGERLQVGQLREQLRGWEEREGLTEEACALREQNEFLNAKLAIAETRIRGRALEARRAEEEARAARRKLQASAAQQAGLAQSCTAMAKRVTDLEHGFGKLLAPEPNGPTAAIERERWGVPLVNSRRAGKDGLQFPPLGLASGAASRLRL